MDNIKKINDLLVNLFNVVFKLEEKALKESTRRDLSLTELHTLVAIGEGKPKTMSQVAAALQISVGTLTVSVSRLVKKGYAERFRIPEDKRIVKVKLTEEGIAAVREHEEFHMSMIRDAVSQIPEEQLGKFIESIDNINEYLVMRKHPPAKDPGPFSLKPMELGKVHVPVPIFQGALSIGLSMSRLASAVAREGGVGVIAASKIGFRERDFRENPLEANKRALRREIKRALQMAGSRENRGPIGVNILWSSKNCREYVKTAVEAGAEVIICGAGSHRCLKAGGKYYYPQLDQEIQSDSGWVYLSGTPCRWIFGSKRVSDGCGRRRILQKHRGYKGRTGNAGTLPSNCMRRYLQQRRRRKSICLRGGWFSDGNKICNNPGMRRQ